VRRRELMKCTK